MQMKAMVVVAHGGPEGMELQERGLPSPGAGQVRLQMLATSVNFADVKARRAPYRHFQAPFVPGFDGVGIVEHLGEGVSGLEVGQRVAAYVKGGSYAEYALADADLCYALPESVKDEDAVGIGVAITAHNALHWAGRLQAGERVLVHAGAGGVGSAALQLARLHGAEQIIASVGSEAKRARCEALRADHVVLTQPGFAKEVMALTGGVGIDVLLDTIGGSVLEEGLDCLADFGRLVTFGHSSSADGNIPSRPLHRHNRAIIGYSSGGYRKKNPALLKPSAAAVIDLWAKGALHTPIGGRFSLAEIPQAHELFEQRKNTGKLFIQVAN